MSRDHEDLQGITFLGNQHTTYPTDYNPDLLETFINKHPDRDYFVKFNCPEFTSLCPMTGQPDYATIYISYVPDERMVESKALKLYLFSFRNHGDFHEDCVNIIMDDLIDAMDPKYIEVWGNSCLAAASASIPTAITAVPVRLGKTLPGSVCPNMTYIPKKWIIGETSYLLQIIHGIIKYKS